MMKILAFDTETGGLDPKEADLLTAYFEVIDQDYNTLDSLSLTVKPDGEALIKAHPKALEVNRIVISEHVQKAIPYSEARGKLLRFLSKHSSLKNKLTPMAHNISFDLGFVNTYLLGKKEWDQYVSYHTLDTGTLATALKFWGAIPGDYKLSLGSLAEFFKVKLTSQAAHIAEGDVKAMIEIFKNMGG